MPEGALTEEILLTAIDKELQAERFYATVARRIKNKRGKKRIVRLAKEENHHGILLKRRWVIHFHKSFDKMQVSNVDPKFEHAKEDWFDSASPLEIVSFAIGIEDRSIQFYGDLLNSISHRADTKLAKRLIRFEESHKQLLQREYQELSRWNYWKS